MRCLKDPDGGGGGHLRSGSLWENRRLILARMLPIVPDMLAARIKSAGKTNDVLQGAVYVQQGMRETKSRLKQNGENKENPGKLPVEGQSNI